MWLFWNIIWGDGGDAVGGPPLTPGSGKLQFFYRKPRNR